ncbi:mannose-binding protein [Streptomyces sp. NPDC001822]|uniref:mannose-binding protein n=1 Tax=Streptomyces sp. NPDC001822 TaxID=3364614 RepID=UPI0036B6182F
MSPQHPTPGASSAAAADPDAQEAGSPPPSPEPAAETPDGAPAALTPAATTAPEPEAEPAADPAAGATPGTPPATAPTTATAEAAEEGVALAAAATAPGTMTATAVDRGRPRTPVLAGAAFLGAALIAIPLLLVGTANDDDHGKDAKAPTAGSADTVLNPDSAPAALEDYVAGKPSPSPSKEKPKKVEAPVPVAPKPVTSAPKPKASSTPAKKPKPKPAPPKPDWTTATISAPSVIGVDQAWTTNRIKMVMQTDGNLVVLNEEGKPIWASMTFGPNHRAIFQPDGNLVIHNGDDRPIWASKTHDHPGAQLVLRPDAKVVVVANGTVLWST